MSTTLLVTYLETALRKMDHESPFGLRGWLKYLKFQGQAFQDGQQDEVAITRSLCKYLTELGLPSAPRVYPGGGGFCDIVSSFSDKTEGWIEAKIYYTIYFDDNDASYTRPRMCGGSQSWKARIESLANDCRNKLWETDGGAGLLIGFEITSDVGDVHQKNPSQSTIETFMRDYVRTRLPGWAVHPLNAGDVWTRTLPDCPQYRFVTRCWLWTKEIPTEAQSTRSIGEAEIIGRANDDVQPEHRLDSTPAVSPKDRAKLGVAAVARFCSVHYTEHDRLGHYWPNLIQEISVIQLGYKQPIDVAGRIAGVWKKWYPNNSDWNNAVNGIGVHKLILDLITRRLSGK